MQTVTATNDASLEELARMVIARDLYAHFYGFAWEEYKWRSPIPNEATFDHFTGLIKHEHPDMLPVMRRAAERLLANMKLYLQRHRRFR